MFIGKVDNLFSVDVINRKFNHKFNRNAANEEEKGFLCNDTVTISAKGKAMNTIERLMKQKDFIKECKASLLEQMTNNETGYCSADITKKLEEYEKQLDSLDEQIAKEMAKQTDGIEESSNGIYKKNQSMTKQETNNKRMADITKMSTELGKSEMINSVKNRLEGEKGVLEAELKSGDSERKRQRIAEIDNRTAELSKETGETLARVNKISNDSEESLTEGIAVNVDTLNKNMNGDAQGKKETQGSLMSPNAFLRTMD